MRRFTKRRMFGRFKGLSREHEESLRTYLGGRIAYTMKVNDKFTLIPELRGFWEHEFLQGENIDEKI